MMKGGLLFGVTGANDLFIATGILLLTLVAMLVVRLLWKWALRPLVRSTGTDLDDLLLLPLRKLVLWGLLVFGLYQAVLSIELVKTSAQAVHVLRITHALAWMVLVALGVRHALNTLTTWYDRRSVQADPTHSIHREVTFIQKVGNILILAFALLFALHFTGVDVTPLLAGGAIGGLAVALALQDTLSNLFAGFYLTVDKPAAVGDFIRLESGEEGFVEEIGWRSTKVRLWANNLVVVPNAKLSQSVITNYFLPAEEMSVYVPCGVAYDSNLDEVERVAVAVAKEVMDQVAGSSQTWEPVVRWQSFADSAITFITVLRVTDFAAQYVLKSEFIKALHRRFGEEGIEIPFPIRSIVMKTPVAYQELPLSPPVGQLKTRREVRDISSGSVPPSE